MLNRYMPHSKSNIFRQRRVEMLNTLISQTLATKELCNIIDVGGTAAFWMTWDELVDWERVSVTCVNINEQQSSEQNPRVNVHYGNACDLSDIADLSFDVAFSNSVIEHVGQWADMEAMAKEIRRVASRYLVQTPYYWFPIEPHARTPFLHWLPEPIAYRIVMNFECGFWSKAKTVGDALRTIQSAKLIDWRQMSALFPDAHLKPERFVGLTKSMIAIRS